MASLTSVTTHRHRREFSDNDVVKIGPGDWDYYNMSGDD